MSEFDPDPVLADALNPISRATFEAKLYEIYDTLGVDRSQWKAGYVMDALTRGTSILLAGVSQLISEIGRGGFLDTASTQWLRLKAYFDYGTRYLEASQAQGTLRIINNSLSVYSAPANAVIVEHNTSGKKYRVIEAINVTASSYQDVAIIAIESGIASNAAIDQIQKFVTAAPQGVSCTNVTSVVGRDEESNAELVVRARESVAQWSPNNPRGSYAARLKTVTRSDGSSIGVTRVRPVPDGFGNVVVYVASPSGEISSPTDLASLNEAVYESVEPEGVNSVVVSATGQDISINATIYTNGQGTASAVSAAVQSAILTFFGQQQIGGTYISGVGYLFRDALLTAMFNAHASIVHIVMSSPAADTVLSYNAFPNANPISLTVQVA